MRCRKCGGGSERPFICEFCLMLVISDVYADADGNIRIPPGSVLPPADARLAQPPAGDDPVSHDDASRIIAGILARPADFEKLAAGQAARTDPWRWYCRLCGAKGEAPEREARDAAAAAHLADTPCGRHGITGRAEAGRLLHVWTYPRSAVAGQN